MNPRCSRCKGAGFVHPRFPDGKPNYSAVISCDCRLEPRQQYRQTEAFVQEKGFALEPTFDNFRLVEGAEQAFIDARKLADGTAEFIWLAIYGGTGCGKTHLAQAAAKLAAQRGVDVRFYRTADLFSTIRQAIGDNTVEVLVSRLKTVRMLVLDDYGVEYGTEWEAAKLDEIMTARFAEVLPTLITTNKDLADFPERLRSRFLDHDISRAIHDSAPDFRPKK